MKQIKVSLLQKGILFIINILLLINILVIPQNIFLFEENLFFLGIYFLNILVFYYILKNKLLAIKLYLILLLLNIFLIYGFYDFFMNIINQVNFIGRFEPHFFITVVFILFLLLIIYNLYFLHKNIKKGIHNLKEKLITSKNQTKTFIIINVCTIIILLIFRFGYYSIEKDIKTVDKSFFITKYQNIDITNKDNLYIPLKNFEYEELKEKKKLKQEIVRCLYKNICFPIEYHKDMVEIDNGTLIDTKELKKKRFRPNCGVEEIREYQCKNNLTDEKEIKLVQNYLNDYINILYEFKNENDLDKKINDLINNLSNKKYYKSDIGDVTILTGTVGFNRDIQYKVLYYLNNNDEEKAVNLLNSQIITNLTMLDGDTYLIDILVAVTTLGMGLDNLDLILNNFNLTEKSKKQLENTLSKNIDYPSIFENIWKNEHKSASQFITELPSTTTLYNHDYTMRGFEEIVFDRIKNKGDFSDDIYKKYKKINYFKSNQLGQLFWQSPFLSNYESQYKKVDNIGNKIEKISDKLQEN